MEELADKLSFSSIKNDDEDDEDEKLKSFSLAPDETADELEDDHLSYASLILDDEKITSEEVCGES